MTGSSPTRYGPRRRYAATPAAAVSHCHGTPDRAGPADPLGRTVAGIDGVSVSNSLTRASNGVNDAGHGFRSYRGGESEFTALITVVREISNRAAIPPWLALAGQPPDQRPILQSDHSPIVECSPSFLARGSSDCRNGITPVGGHVVVTSRSQGPWAEAEVAGAEAVHGTGHSRLAAGRRGPRGQCRANDRVYLARPHDGATKGWHGESRAAARAAVASSHLAPV